MSDIQDKAIKMYRDNRMAIYQHYLAHGSQKTQTAFNISRARMYDIIGKVKIDEAIDAQNENR